MFKLLLLSGCFVLISNTFVCANGQNMETPEGNMERPGDNMETPEGNMERPGDNMERPGGNMGPEETGENNKGREERDGENNIEVIVNAENKDDVSFNQNKKMNGFDEEKENTSGSSNRPY